ncbi:DUF1810 domain-containing protein [Solirubrobacter soli]|uniref:DUF1810 domain-containing protein n=1 Tax=Solirubrobacter soli TaxID=363832 RepID=UPI000420EFE8|nr:DUF1810 domain-containing protein [Solirubrobacter soli]
MNAEDFVAAQDRVWPAVLDELRAGRKTSHWMWFVFPQLAGLGHSPMSKRYALADAGEAREFYAHPVLGPRLRECCELLLTHTGLSAFDIFGGIDAMKLRSSMTLFSEATGDPLFERVLSEFGDGGQ